MRMAHTRRFVGISGGVKWGGHDTEEEERGKGIELAVGGLSPLAITDNSYSSNAIDTCRGFSEVSTQDIGISVVIVL
jgi:hypothetical protein